MCGIAGFSLSGMLGKTHLSGMLETLSYRGPDDRGFYLDQRMAIGNTLLAIVDIGNGRQPFLREYRGETYVAVFNGEIYNHGELRKKLEAEGFRFRTNCDTEVAVAAYAAWGSAAASRFDGQWALAIWEARGHRLFLSRDPFGIKPLYYYREDGFFAFASEPKAILSLPNVPKRPNVEAIQEYFLHGFAFAAGYCLNHRSFYEGVHSVPPGHSLLWQEGSEPAITRYFDYPLARTTDAPGLEEAAVLLREAVGRSIEASMMGDAPLGVALSGGLDSSVITTIAARVAVARGTAPLLASCIRYRSQSANEDAEHAAILAKWLAPDVPVDLVFSVMDVNTYMLDLDLMIRHFDEPHWEVKQLAMFNNYRCLRAHGAKAVLTGEGADELFFGYYHNFPGFKRPHISSGNDLLAAWGARIPVVRSLLTGSTERGLRDLQQQAIERFYEPASASGADPERSMQCWYLATFLHWLLIDNDRCSMAFSLEGRFPFLNRDVYELAFRLPASLQIGKEHGEEKLVLREAFRDLLPEEIWRRRKKAPLPSPLQIAFHGVVRDALRAAIDDAPPEAWEVVNRQGAQNVLNLYSESISRIELQGSLDQGGDELTKYLRLDEPWSVRTPHAFGLLTFFRWWKMNFD